MPPAPDRDPPGAAPDNPLVTAFTEALDTPYGPAHLTAALDAVLLHLVEAHRRGIPYGHLADVLSQVCVAAGRPAVSEATLRGLFRRLRLRAASAGRLPVVPRPPAPEQTIDPQRPTSMLIPPPPAPLPGRMMHPPAGAGPLPVGPGSGLSKRARGLAQARRELVKPRSVDVMPLPRP